MIAKHLLLIDQAAAQGVRILSLQKLFYGPYFAAEQDARWYEFTERVPDGPTIKLMQDVARKHEMAMVVPVYEEEANRAVAMSHHRPSRLRPRRARSRRMWRRRYDGA
jgi:predicted amidohydrolase